MIQFTVRIFTSHLYPFACRYQVDLKHKSRDKARTQKSCDRLDAGLFVIITSLLFRMNSYCLCIEYLENSFCQHFCQNDFCNNQMKMVQTIRLAFEKQVKVIERHLEILWTQINDPKTKVSLNIVLNSTVFKFIIRITLTSMQLCA